MSVLLEHDNIIKSRRALIISSVVVISLHYVQLNSNEIEIFKLQVAVSKGSLIIAAKLSTLYLLYIFALQAIKRYIERFIRNRKNSLASLSDGAETKVTEFNKEYEADILYGEGSVGAVDAQDLYIEGIKNNN